MKSSLRQLTIVVIGLVSCFSTSPTQATDAPVVDIGAIGMGGLEVKLQEFARLPATNGDQRDDISQFGNANDGSNRVFVSTIGGQIWDFDASGTRSAQPFLDIGGSVIASQFDNRDNPSSGLRGFAFHPDYNRPGTDGYRKIYTSHVEQPQSGSATFGLKPEWGVTSPAADMVLAEWSLDPQTSRVDQSSYRQVMRINHPSAENPAQQLAFNTAAQPGDADYGNLYWAVGDGALNPHVSQPDGLGIAQDLSTPLGSVLRVNPLQDGTNGYSVPADNPFENDGDANTLGEIYSYGLRDPATISVNRLTGHVFVGDVGLNNVEEINLLAAGTNHGWGDTEGTFAFTDPNDSNSLALVPTADRLSGLTNYPVLQFDHLNNSRGAADNWESAVVGGFVYDGGESPKYTGKYIFGNEHTEGVFFVDSSLLKNDQIPEFISRVRFVDEAGNTIDLGDRIIADSLDPSSIDEVDSEVRVGMRFGQDEEGELYLISKANDVVYRPRASPRSWRNSPLNGCRRVWAHHQTKNVTSRVAGVP